MSGAAVLLRAVLLLSIAAGVAAAAGGVLLLAGASFAAPDWLHLAWLAPALVLLDGLATWRRGRAARTFGEPGAVARLVEGAWRGVRAARTALAASAVVLLAVAASRPQWGSAEELVRRKGVDVFVCIDTSRSMLAEDVKPSRMARARLAVGSLLDRLADDRVGLIAFAGEARLVCPLTLDRAAARLFLDTVEPGLLQRPGTALAPAMRLALRSLQAASERQGVVVLVTDGEDHGGDALDAAKELAASGVVVHAIGLGEPEGVPLAVVERDARGVPQRTFVKDESGGVVLSRLDETTLRAIAQETGGTYARVSPSELELTQVAAEIASLEQAELSSTRRQVKTERYAWFLGAAFLLLVLEAFLPDGAAPWGGRALGRVTRVAALRASEERRQARRVA